VQLDCPEGSELHDPRVVRLEQGASHSAFIFGFLARDNARQSIIRAERLAAELIENIDRLFAPLPLDEGNRAQRARAVDQRKRVLADWRRPHATAMAMRQHGVLKPCPTLMFVNGAGELDKARPGLT
jgi:hypothetical protein